MKEKKKVLFVCIENSCRSQMAEGFANTFGREDLRAYSAGSRPSGIVNPDAILVMREVQVDIANRPSKGFAALPAVDFDYVITLGCGEQCPFFPGARQMDWKIPDPKGQDLNFFRQVRDDIFAKVTMLISEIAGKNC